MPPLDLHSGSGPCERLIHRQEFDCWILPLVNQPIHVCDSCLALFLSLLDDLKSRVDVIGDRVIDRLLNDDNLLLSRNDLVRLEKWAVEHRRLVFATFTADIEPELGLQLVEIRLQLSDGLAEVNWLQSHAADLDDLRVQPVIDHLLKQWALLPQPEVRQGHQAQS